MTETVLNQEPLELTSPVVRTYTVGVRFDGDSPKERQAVESKAFQIVTDLQRQVRAKLTTDRMEEAITQVRKNPFWHGTTGASRLAELFSDRSNLGQISYLYLLNAAKGHLAKEKKLKKFLEFLAETPHALAEWIVLGRCPYLEWRVQRYFDISFDYSRNFILGARHQLETWLPPKYQLTQPTFQPTCPEILSSIEDFRQQIVAQFDQLPKLSKGQKTFLNHLQRLYSKKEEVAKLLLAWFQEFNSQIGTFNSPATRWKQLKELSRKVETLITTKPSYRGKAPKYFSLVRNIVVFAVAPAFQQALAAQPLVEDPGLQVLHLVQLPFNQAPEDDPTPLPLQLVMGSQYVIGRPGNSLDITELVRAKQGFPVTFWPPRQKKQAVAGQVRIHPRLQQFFQRGAELRLVVVRTTRPPNRKILVDLVCEGEAWMFLSKTAIQDTIPGLNLSNDSVSALGIDINRVSDHVLAFSEELDLPEDLKALTRKYLHLEEVLGNLTRCLTKRLAWFEARPTAGNRYRLEKIKTELNSVYNHRCDLLKEIHRSCRRLIASVLIATQSPLLCVENLKLTARGTRGPLAKAVLNMPDDPGIYGMALLLVEWITGKKVGLAKVNPFKTSQGHHIGCSKAVPGDLTRSASNYDEVVCPSCDQLVDTHVNAAKLIRDRGVSQTIGS